MEASKKNKTKRKKNWTPFVCVPSFQFELPSFGGFVTFFVLLYHLNINKKRRNPVLVKQLFQIPPSVIVLTSFSVTWNVLKGNRFFLSFNGGGVFVEASLLKKFARRMNVDHFLCSKHISPFFERKSRRHILPSPPNSLSCETGETFIYFYLFVNLFIKGWA